MATDEERGGDGLAPPDPDGESNEGIPEPLENLPEQIQQVMAYQGPASNPILSKVNEQHISEAIEFAKTTEEHHFQLAKREQDTERSNRWFGLAAFLVAATLLIALVWLLKDKPDVLLPTLSGIAGLLAGLLGGYGWGRSRTELEE